jgi:hypothetical protein
MNGQWSYSSHRYECGRKFKYLVINLEKEVGPIAWRQRLTASAHHLGGGHHVWTNEGTGLWISRHDQVRLNLICSERGLVPIRHYGALYRTPEGQLEA